MVKRTYAKLSRRGIKSTAARFFAILGISFLGVGFLCGLLATTPDMQDTMDAYYDEYAMFDLNVRGDMGMTKGDVEALAAQPWVEKVMPARVTDVEMDCGGQNYVVRLYGVELAEGRGSEINGFELISGRMPQDPSECLITAPNGFTEQHKIGDAFTVTGVGMEEDIGEVYAQRTYTVVGIVRSPYYISIESEPSAQGKGSVDVVMFAAPECYSLEVYTDMFLLAAGARELPAFSQEYIDMIDDVTARLEDFGEVRCNVRQNEIKSEARSEVEDAERELAEKVADAEAEIEDARAELSEGWAEYSDGEKELEQAQADLEAARREVRSSQTKLSDAKYELENAEAQLSATFSSESAKLEAMKPYMTPEQYEGAKAQLSAGMAQGYAQIEEARTQIEEGEKELSRAKRRIAEAETEIEENCQKLEDARAELMEGENELIDARLELDEETADAEAEIEDARREIEDVERPEWYITDRSDTVSYSSYKSNSEKIAAVARVFPIFFFTVAALVALTTMTRLIDEERMQMGTLKSLGYGNGAILSYYLIYSVSASLIGGAAGAVVGFKLFPYVITNAYKMMYTLPDVIMSFRWGYALWTVAAMVACTVIATLAACLAQLSEKPSQLIMQKAPAVGKRIFLERIGFIWRRMSFTGKVTARNIFRYKKRLYMTVIGIAGCCALLVTGFGLRDSIHDIVDKQFGEIYNYNLTLYLSEDSATEEDGELAGYIADSEYIESCSLVHTQSGRVEYGGKKENVTILVPKVVSELPDDITFRDRKSGELLEFSEDTIVLTEKLSEQLGVSVGDTVTVENADNRSARYVVSAFTENYVSGFVFMSQKEYDGGYGGKIEYKTAFVRTTHDDAAARDEISQQLLKSDKVLLARFSETIKESFRNTVRSIDYIVIVLILSAGALAIIVLYNLTNINICERRRELATIKVLGFHEREVASYIYRETSVLALMGTALGFGLGAWLHSYVVRTAEVDAVMFGREIYFTSFLYAAAVTVVFTLLVDLIMLKKLRSIDMVESMKSTE